MALRIRRGTDAQRSGVTFEMGEIVWTTDGQQLFVGNGVTQGGTAVIGAQILGYGLVYDSLNKRIEVAGLTSDDVTEGSNRLYHTTERAVDAVGAALVAGNATNVGITFTYSQTQDDAGRINATVALDGVGITEVAADTSPSLGGNLDLNENDITGSGNINVVGSIQSSSIDSASIVTNELETSVITSATDLNFTFTENATFNGRNILISNANAGPTVSDLASIAFLSSRGTASSPTAIQLNDKVSTYTGAGWNGTDYTTLGGISIGASVGTLGTEELPGVITMFVLGDNGGFDSFAQLDSSGVFTSLALQSFGLTTTQKTSIINKFGGVGVGENTVRGMIVYDTTLNKLTTFHPTEGWGNILTSTSPVASTSYFKVGVFADNTARNTAVETPAAGMIVFNTSSGKFEGYDGSAWVALN